MPRRWFRPRRFFKSRSSLEMLSPGTFLPGWLPPIPDSISGSYSANEGTVQSHPVGGEQAGTEVVSFLVLDVAHHQAEISGCDFERVQVAYVREWDQLAGQVLPHPVHDLGEVPENLRVALHEQPEPALEEGDLGPGFHGEQKCVRRLLPQHERHGKAA